MGGLNSGTFQVGLFNYNPVSLGPKGVMRGYVDSSAEALDVVP